jgi:hypothetical protein
MEILNPELTSIFVKNGKVFASNGYQVFEVKIHQPSSTSNTTENVQKVLYAIGEGKLAGISTSDLKINNQPISVFGKKPIIETRLGTKEQTPINNLSINTRDLNIGVVVQDEPNKISLILGEDYQITKALIITTFPSGLYAVSSTNGALQNKLVEFQITVQQKVEVAENTFENLGSAVIEKISLTKQERKKFEHRQVLDFGSYLKEGQKGGIFEIKIHRITAFDGQYSTSVMMLDRITEYLYVTDARNIAYSDTSLLYLEAVAQSTLSGSIPQPTIHVFGNEVMPVSKMIQNSIYGQSKILNGSPVPKDQLQYEENSRIKKELSKILLRYGVVGSNIGQVANIFIENITTGDVTTIKNISSVGNIQLRSHIFKNTTGGERFAIRVPEHSYNMIDQVADLLTNPDYGIGRSFEGRIVDYKNFSKLADKHYESVPIDGSQFLINGELGPVVATQESNTTFQKVFLQEIDFQSNAFQLDFFRELMEYMYPGFSSFLNGSNVDTPPVKNTSPSTTETMLDFIPREVFDQTYDIPKMILDASNPDFIFKIKMSLNYNHYLDGNGAIKDNINDGYVTNTLRRNNQTPPLYTGAENTPPFVYEVAFYGATKSSSFTKIKTFMVDHRHTPGSTQYTEAIKHQEQVFSLNLYDFVTVTLSETLGGVDANSLEDMHIKVVIRVIPHLFWYSQNFTDAVSEIDSFENTLTTELIVNKAFYEHLHDVLIPVGQPTDNNYVSEFANFIKGIYSNSDDVFNKLVAYGPPGQSTATKNEYHAVYVNSNVFDSEIMGHDITEFTLQDIGSWSSVFFPDFFKFRKDYSNQEITGNSITSPKSGIIKIDNYDGKNVEGNIINITSVNLFQLLFSFVTEFRTGTYDPIYKHVTEIQTQIKPGDIIYNLTTFERAMISELVYQDDVTGNLTTDPQVIKTLDHIKTTPPIFNENGLNDDGSIATFRIYAKEQCEIRHKSSFIISQFSNPKEYLPVILSASNTMMNITGDKIRLFYQGLTDTDPKEEVIISESDMIPNSLDIQTKSRTSVMNTVEIQFMDQRSENNRQTVTVRDRNALQGLDEDGNQVRKPLPERKQQMFYPSIGRPSEAIRKANYFLNFEKHIDHVLSFATFGVGGHLLPGDTFQFRAPITRKGLTGAIINKVVNPTVLTTGEEMTLTLSNVIGDILGSTDKIISDQFTGDLAGLYFDYDRSRNTDQTQANEIGETIHDIKDYWAILMSGDVKIAKLRIERINGTTVVIDKTTILTDWIELVHDDYLNITNGDRIIIGEKDSLATRYQLVSKHENRTQSVYEFEAHPYYPKVHSDFSTFAVLHEVGKDQNKNARKQNSPSSPVRRCRIESSRLRNRAIETQSGETSIRKIFDLVFNFQPPADTLYQYADIYWKWSNESDVFIEAGNNGWKRVSGGPYHDSFMLNNLPKENPNVVLEILIISISKFGVKLAEETAKLTSRFRFTLKEYNELVPFPKDFTVELNEQELQLNFNWKPVIGLKEYQIHVEIDQNEAKYGGDYGWGFAYSRSSKILNNNFLASSWFTGTNFLFPIKDAGTYRFMIRGKTESGFMSGELSDFFIDGMTFRSSNGNLDITTTDLTTIPSDDILCQTSHESDDLSILMGLLQKTAKVLGKAYFIFSANEDALGPGYGIKIQKSFKMSSGTNRYKVNRLDLTFLHTQGFKFMQIPNTGLAPSINFWPDTALTEHIINNAGPGWIEFTTDPFISTDPNNKFFYLIVDITPTTTIEEKSLIFTHEAEEITTGVAKSPCRIKDILIQIEAPNSVLENMLQTILYNPLVSESDFGKDQLASIDSELYDLQTSMRMDRNILPSDPNIFAPDLVAKIRDINDNSKWGYNTSGLKRKDVISNSIAPEITKLACKVLVPTEIGKGLADSLQPSGLITFVPVQGVENLILNYVPKSGQIRATWDKQDTLLLDHYELRVGFYLTGQSVPIWASLTNDEFQTIGTEYVFDINSIDEDIIGNKNFIVYILAVDKNGLKYSDVIDPISHTFTLGQNTKTFLIEALPQVDFDLNDVIENTYADSSGNVISEILLRFRLPNATWESGSVNRRNLVKELKIKTRKVEEPISTGIITSIGTNEKITDNIRYGIVSGETPLYDNDSNDSKFINKLIRINGIEAYIVGNENNNTFLLDRSITQSIGDNFEIIERYDVIGSMGIGTDILSTELTSQNINRELEFRIPLLEQGNKYKSLSIWEFKITAINTFNIENSGIIVKKTLQGKPDVIEKPLNATVREVPSGVIFEAQQPPDSDFQEFQFRAVFLDPNDEDSEDNVNKSFELKSIQKENQYFSSEVDKNGAWGFYIFSVDKSGNRSIGFNKVQLDVYDLPVKKNIQTIDMLLPQGQPNGFELFEGCFRGLDGNIYPRPAIQQIQFTIDNADHDSNNGISILRLKNLSFISLGLTLDYTSDILFDASQLISKMFTGVSGNLGTCILLDDGSGAYGFDDLQNPDESSITIISDLAESFSTNDLITFDLEPTYGTHFGYGENANPQLPSVTLEVIGDGRNPSWRFDGFYSANGNVNASGGYPPFTYCAYTSDVYQILDQDVTYGIDLIPEYYSQNQDEFEDTCDFHVWYRLGDSLSDFSILEIENNPYKPFKKFRIDKSKFIQIRVFFSIKNPITSASIKKLSLIIDREQRRIQVNNGVDNFIDVPMTGYNFIVQSFYEIIDYSSLMVIDDLPNDIFRPYIDVQALNNSSSNSKYSVVIFVINGSGQKVAGKVAGSLVVY